VTNTTFIINISANIKDQVKGEGSPK